MAKQLLLDVLANVLGTYVEGLSVQNLKVGVLTGEIEFTNLQLKKTALDGLNLPITVVHGSLKQLKCKISWTALESKPVRVFIDGVYLQCRPLDVSNMTTEHIKKSAFDIKRSRLQAAEDAVIIANENPESFSKKTEKLSYFQQLAAKIVDNVEVTLTNVHIRYEDDVSLPGRVLSAGLTIGSITLKTTDNHWNEAFVAREGGLSGAEAIHKLGRLENLGLYWNTSSESLELKTSFADWEIAMQTLIYTNQPNQLVRDVSSGSKSSLIADSPKRESTHDCSSLNYLLSTPNSLTMKVTHIEHPLENQPKIDIELSSSNLGLHIDDSQYHQIMDMLTVLPMLERKKQISLLRPEMRPNVDPRGWWHFAFKLITGNSISTAEKVHIMQYIKNE